MDAMTTIRDKAVRPSTFRVKNYLAENSLNTVENDKDFVKEYGERYLRERLIQIGPTITSEILTMLETNQENRPMVETMLVTDTDISQPVEVEINTVGELVIVFKSVPKKFEQKFDRKKMTYTLRATWKP